MSSRNPAVTLFVVLLLASVSSAQEGAQDGVLEYPTTPRGDVIDTHHGVSVADPYRWLEKTESQDTRAWIRAQDELTRSHLDELSLRKSIEEQLDRIGAIRAPSVRSGFGGRWFATLRDPSRIQGVFSVEDSESGEPRPILDPNPLSRDGSIGIRFTQVSPNGRHVAYAFGGGESWMALRVRDVDSGEDLPETFEGTLAAKLTLDWAPDSRGFFYTRVDGAQVDGLATRGLRVMYHRVGTSQSEDTLIDQRPELPNLLYFSARPTDDGRYLVFTTMDNGWANTRGVSYLDLTTPGATRVELIPDGEALFQFEGSAGSVAWIRTDHEAPHGRILAIDLDDPDRSSWTALVEESEHQLRGVSDVGDYLLCRYFEDGRDSVVVHDAAGNEVGRFAPRGSGSFAGLTDQWAGKEVFFYHSSPVDPGSVYRFDLTTGDTSLHERSGDIPWAPDEFVTRTVKLEPRDGAPPLLRLSHRAGLGRDGEAPVMLSGFGAFGSVATPSFSPPAMQWMRMGGIFAFATIRGDGTHGQAWRDAGQRAGKQNAVDDLLAAADWLIEEGYSSPGRIVVTAGSGGSVVGAAAAMQRPDLFGAAVIDFPMLDMLRYGVQTTGGAWHNEFGSVADEREFQALLALSPYHNVEKGRRYVPTLISAGELDPSTPPFHAYKFVAALQAAAPGSSAPMLLRIEWGGHHYPRGAERTRAWNADRLAFAAAILGLELGGN